MIEDGKSLNVPLCVGDNFLDYASDSDPYDHATLSTLLRRIRDFDLKPWNC
jgi:hypothetical protein